MRYNSIIIAILCTITIIACKKKDTTTTTSVDTGSVHLEFFNVVGGSNLNLNNQWYKNQHGDSFTVSKLNYYISNIVLKGSGTTADYTETNSYHLVEHTTTGDNMSFNLARVPAGTYKSIQFMIGVDSLHNVSGAQGGELDPAKGNFWSWNTGYIMLKFEGNSPQAPTTDGMLVFHCGGFSGVNNVLKTVTLDLPSSVAVTKTAIPHVHLTADVLQLFRSPNVIDFSQTTAIHMPGADARRMADNYATMFTITYAGL